MSTLAIVRGLAGLGVDATTGVTDIVEGMYRNISAGSPPLGPEPQGPARGIAGLVHACIRDSTRTIGGAADAMLKLAPAAQALDDAGTPERDAWLAAINGVVGDHLHAKNNPLAITLQFRRGNSRLDCQALAGQIDQPGDTLLLLAHGLCMNPHQWSRDGRSHADAVEAETGATAVHLWYNTGRPVADNGQALAQALQDLVAAWPVPLRRVQLLGHSMGGLVLRSALAHAEAADLSWRKQVTHLVCLGTPHCGAPLERAGHALNSAVGRSPYTAPLGRLGWLRSAGITDLRFGAVVAEAPDAPPRFAPGWRPATVVPLPEGVQCSAVAATLGGAPGDLKDRLAGDGLVPVRSALGQAADGASTLAFDAENTLTCHNTNHWQLLDDGPVRQFVLQQLRA